MKSISLMRGVFFVILFATFWSCKQSAKKENPAAQMKPKGPADLPVEGFVISLQLLSPTWLLPEPFCQWSRRRFIRKSQEDL